jgi:hypothetical protein
LITIPVPAEGADAIDVSAVASSGVVTEFSDPSGILAEKTVSLTLSAPAGRDRIDYAAIAAIEAAFKGKGAAVSSNTAGGAIPVFDATSYKDGVVNDDLALLAQRATAQNPEVKIVNGIKALYNGGNQVLQVQSPMQLTGDIWCSQLDRIQTTQGNIYADETLRLWENGRDITLANFLAAYAKCGFDLGGNNNFFPKPGNISQNTGNELTLNITDTAKSFDIYKLFERYHGKGKLANLDELRATNITIAGDSADGLYGANNQPSASFPYRVKGEVLGAMLIYADHYQRFAGFENLYEYTGNLSLPEKSGMNRYNVRNFATESHIANVGFDASGSACFFRDAPGHVTNAGAVKIMRATTPTSIGALYIDLRDLPISDAANVQGGAKEVAFASAAAFKAKATGESMSLTFPRDINYANDNSGITKLIGATSEGFDTLYASARDTGLYGVLDLQDWTDGAPPATKTAADFEAAGMKWTAAEFNQLLSSAVAPYANRRPALVLTSGAVPAAVLDDKRRGLPAGGGRAV